MLKKIIVNNKQYTVDLLTAKEVIKAIPKKFIYSDSSGEYEFNKLTSYEKDNFINQHIHYYEKVEYEGKSYFILKSNIPLTFLQKNEYNKKLEISSYKRKNLITSILFPVENIINFSYSISKNLLNFFRVKHNKITTINILCHDKILDLFSEKKKTPISIISFLTIAPVCLFFFSFFLQKEYHFYIMGIFMLNFILNFVKIDFNYINPDNYVLAPLQFENDKNPIDRLNNMKLSNFSLSKTEEQSFHFNTKEINY